MAKKLRDEIRPVKPHLTEGKGGVAGEVDDVRRDMQVVCDRIEEEFKGGGSTTEEGHRYADSVNGNDENDGSSWAKAVKTWNGIRKVLAQNIGHHINFHLKGAFVKQWFENLERTLTDMAHVVFDGGDELTVVLDDAGSPIVSDVGSVNTIGNTGLAWTLDQYTGYMVEITDGPLAGELRTITRNSTGGVISVLIPFSGDPTGAGFRIVKPATEIQEVGTPFDFAQSARNNWAIHGTGDFVLQRLTLSGTMPLTLAGGNPGKNAFKMAACVVEKPLGYWHVGSIFHQGVIDLTYLVEDPDVLGGGTLLPLNQAGVGSTGGDASTILADLLVEWGGGWLTVDGCFFNAINVNAAGNWGALLDRSRAKVLYMMATKGYERSFVTNSEFGGYKAFGSPVVTNPPVEMVNSTLNLRDCDLSADYPYGAVVRASQLRFDGTITGSVNDLDVWAKDHSRIYFESALATIDLGGAVGDLSFDGVTEASDWATILGGTQVNDPNTFSFAKIQPNLGV